MGYIDILLTPDARKIEFSAGEQIQGLLRVYKKYSFIVRGVYIEFNGYESLIENSNPPKTKKHTIFSKKEFLFGTAKGEYLGKELAAGSHSWPFAFQIPKDVPPSVSHPSGRATITYELVGLCVLIQEQDIVAHQQLIIHPEPLLALPLFDAPRAKNHKSFLLGGGPLTMECFLDKACYPSGGMMTIDVFIDNASNKTIHHILISLGQEWKIEGHKESFNRKDYIYDNNFPVLPHSSYKGTIIVQLPSNIPCSVNTAKWVAVNYIAHISCVVGKSPELTINLPIIISPRLAAVSKVVIGIPIQQQIGVSASFPPPVQVSVQQPLRTTRTSFMPDQFIPVSNLQMPGPGPLPMTPPDIQPHPPPYPPPDTNVSMAPPPVFSSPTAPPIDAPINNYSGWLVKKDIGLFTEKRYFVLDGRNGVLNYFVDRTLRELKGTINLRGATLFPASLDPKAPPFSFDIINTEGVTILSCSSQLELQEWIYALSAHIKIAG